MIPLWAMIVDIGKALGLDPWAIVDTWTFERLRLTETRVLEHAEHNRRAQQRARLRAQGKDLLVDAIGEGRV